MLYGRSGTPRLSWRDELLLADKFVPTWTWTVGRHDDLRDE